MTVTLNGSVGVHLDRPWHGHTPEVVARQIHQHHVLGRFLGVRQQIGFVLRIFCRGRPAWQRTGYRSQRCLSTAQANQRFGR